jgi:bla regulator protein blaR1
MAILDRWYHYPEINQVGPIVRLLLEAGANANSPPSEIHSSVLAAAIFNDNISCVDELIANRANVNAHDYRFVTPLIAAAYHGYLDITKKLVEKGADLTLTCEKFG